MTNNLLESIKEHLSGDVVSNLATIIGESPKNTESALNSAIPSVLAGLADQSGNNQIIGHLFKLLTESGHDGGILSNLGALSRGGDETNKLISEGTRLLDSFFGSKSTGLIDLVSQNSGISKTSASSLLGFITPVVMGMMGKNLKIGNIENASGLASFLNDQSGILKNFLPSGIGALLGGGTLSAALDKIDTESIKATVSEAAQNVLSNFDKATEMFDSDKIADVTAKAGAAITETFDKMEDAVENVAEESLASAKSVAENIGETASQFGTHVVAEGKEFAQSAATAFEEGAGESKKLLPWILIAAAAALIWGLLKSCGESTDTTSEVTATKPQAQIAQPPAPPVAAQPPAETAVPAPIVAEPVKTEPAPAEKISEFFEKTLSTGYALTAANDGFISKLVGFIESNDPISKELWFSMDGITFDTNKATIKKESDAQINDIAEILKAYPKVKVKIGGYTDNTGNPKANKKLSFNRAVAVKKALIGKGIKADRMDAEGYGSDHPVASNETEEGRQQNRRISVRVTEK